MKKLLLIACVLGLLALAALGTATAKPETDCYIIGDVCIIISNVCFLDSYDCGDGTDWFSKRAWVRGWCIAAIYAEVIVGTVKECIEGKARTVAEKVPISSVSGMLVLWQSQYEQYLESIQNGNQQRQEQRSSANGSSSQRSSSSSGGNQQQGQQQQQGDGQNDGNPPPIDPQQPDNSPPQPPDNGNPNQLLIVNDGEDKEDQEDLLNKVLQQQEPQYQGLEGPKGEQGGDEVPDCTRDAQGRLRVSPCIDRSPREDIRVDAPNTVEGGSRPGYHPLKAHSGECKGSVCLNCSWSARYIFKGRDGTVQRICSKPNQNPCTQYESKPVNLVERPSSVTWTYVCK